MTLKVRRALVQILFLFLCGTGSLCSLARVSAMGNALADVDRFSEANVLREVRNFLDGGIAARYGLGNVYYPGLYPGEGFARNPELARASVAADGTYTHYPPGPEYIAWGFANFVGFDSVARLRLAPVAIGWAAMLVLGYAVRRRFGDLAAWLTMGALALTPAVTDGFIGLHYQGYAMALSMVEIGLALRPGPAFAPSGLLGSGLLGSGLLGFALLGFAQGWLSFDYAFLVVSIPLSLEVILPHIDPAHKRNWSLAWMRAILAGMGFTAAHGLHFLQVVAYWGSLEAALRDFGGAAADRAAGDLPDSLVPRVLFVLRYLILYLYGQHPVNFSLTLPESHSPENWSMFRVLGFSLGCWWVPIVLASMLREFLKPSPASRAFRMDWYWVSLTGILTSSVWLLAMGNHAVQHRHFLYRHLFFAFFAAVLFGAVRFACLWREARTAKHRGHFFFLGGHR